MTIRTAGGLVCVALALGCAPASEENDPSRLDVSVSDVRSFVDAWTRLDPSDSTCEALAGYWNRESPGLHAYRRKFDVSQRDLCAAVRRFPERYAALESKLPALDSASSQIRRIIERLGQLHALTRTPAVYFVVGNGISGGTTTGGKDPAVLVGMELNRSVDGLPWVIAHEIVHTQQDYPLWGAMNGGPKFLRGPLVRHAIMEGSANFIAELVTGVLHRNDFGEQHEAQLWIAFQRDANSRDYSRWLYNGGNAAARGDWPTGFRLLGRLQDYEIVLRECLRQTAGSQ